MLAPAEDIASLERLLIMLVIVGMDMQQFVLQYGKCERPSAWHQWERSAWHQWKRVVLLYGIFSLHGSLTVWCNGSGSNTGDYNKVGHLWSLEGAKDGLRLVRADLMVEGSFDAAIMGCDGVFHIASPVLGQPRSDPKAEILQPAIDGTLNVLRSCKKNPSLRRVVLTSSSSAVRVREFSDPRLPLNEASWSSEDLCERFKIWYVLSKTLAEKAAWKFCEENKIDLVTILPSFVIGPSLPPVLCSTASDVLGLFKGETEKFQWHGRMGYVHIDDVATGHVLLYENEKAKGRYLCSSKVVDIDELSELLSDRYPALPISKKFEKVDRPRYELDVAKLKGMGMKFRSLEEMFDDCVQSLTMQGHLSSAI